MRASKTWFLFFCVVLLGGYIWFVEKNRLSPAEQKAVERQAFDLSMDRVDRIGIRTASLEVELVHDGARWMLSEPQGARASQPVVDQLLARFRSLDRGEFITPADMRSRSLTLADFGLEVPQMVLTLGVDEELRVYSVGSPNPLGTSLYVKEESSQNVMLVSSDLLSILPPDPFLFRDSELFPVGPSEVRELSLVSGQGTLRLQREGGGWMILNPVRAPADSAKVHELLTKLSRARLEGGVNRPGPEDMEAFEAGGSPDIIRLWPNTKTIPIELQIGGTVPGNLEKSYARIPGQEGLVVVSKGLKTLAATPPAALRDRSVLSLPPSDLLAVRISDQDTFIHLEKTEQGWRMRDPLELPASGARVQQVVEEWNRATVEAFLPAEDFSAGTEPYGTITFEGKASIHTFTLLSGTAPPGRAFVQSAASEEILQVVPDVVRYLPRDPLSYVSRQLFSLDPSRAVRITLQQGDKSHTLVRPEPRACREEPPRRTLCTIQ